MSQQHCTVGMIGHVMKQQTIVLKKYLSDKSSISSLSRKPLYVLKMKDQDDTP